MDPDKKAARQQLASTEEAAPQRKRDDVGVMITPEQGRDTSVEVGDVIGAAAAAVGTFIAEEKAQREITDKTIKDSPRNVTVISTVSCDSAKNSGGIDIHSDALLATITPPPSESDMVASENQEGSECANSDSAGSSYVTIDLEPIQEASDLSTDADKGAGDEEPATKTLASGDGEVTPQVDSDGESSVLNSDLSVLSELEAEDNRPLKRTSESKGATIDSKLNSSNSDSLEEIDDPMEVETDPVKKQPASKTSTTASSAKAKRRGGKMRRGSASRPKEAVTQGSGSNKESKDPCTPEGVAEGILKLESDPNSPKPEDPVPNAPQTSANLEAMGDWMPVDVDGAEGAAGTEGGDEEMPQQVTAKEERMEEPAATVEGSNPPPPAAATGQGAPGPVFSTDFRRFHSSSPTFTRGYFRGPSSYHYARGPGNGISCRLHRTFPERHMYLPSYGPYNQYGHGPAPERFQRTGMFPGTGDLAQPPEPLHQPAQEPVRFQRTGTFPGTDLPPPPEPVHQPSQGPAPFLRTGTFPGLGDLPQTQGPYQQPGHGPASFQRTGTFPESGDLSQTQGLYHQRLHGPAPESYQRTGTFPGLNLFQTQGPYQQPAHGPAPECCQRTGTFPGLDLFQPQGPSLQPAHGPTPFRRTGTFPGSADLPQPQGPSLQPAHEPTPFQRTGTFPGSADLPQPQGPSLQPAHEPTPFQRTGTFPGSADLPQPQGPSLQPAHEPTPFQRTGTFPGSADLPQPQGPFLQSARGPASEYFQRLGTFPEPVDLRLPHGTHQQPAQGPAPERFQRTGTFPESGDTSQPQGPYHQSTHGPTPIQRSGTISDVGDLLLHVHGRDHDVAELRLPGVSAGPTHRQNEELHLHVGGGTSGASSTPRIVREDISVHIRDNNYQISVYESRITNECPSGATPDVSQGLGYGTILEDILGPAAANFASDAGNVAELAPENVEGEQPRKFGGMPSGHGTTQEMHHSQGGFTAASPGNVSGEVPRDAGTAAANVETIQNENDRRDARGDNAMDLGSAPETGQGSLNATATGNIGADPRSARGDGAESDELPTGDAREKPQEERGQEQGTLRATAGNLVPPSMPRADAEDLRAWASGNLSGGTTGNARPPVQGIAGGASGNVVPPSMPGADRAIPVDLSTSSSGNVSEGTTENARPPVQGSADGTSGNVPPTISGAGAPNNVPRNAPGPVQGTFRIYQRTYRFPFSLPGSNRPTAGGLNAWSPFSGSVPGVAAGNVSGGRANAFRGPPPASSGAIRAAQSALNAPGNARPPHGARGTPPGPYGASRARFQPQGPTPARAGGAAACDCPASGRAHAPRCEAESLVEAAAAGDMAVLIRLLSGGRDPNAVREPDGLFPLYVACARGQLGSVCVLLGFGADPNQRGPHQRTPLHMAAMHGHAAVVTRMLDSAADVFAEDSAGDTPLHMAGYSSRWEVVAALLRRGPMPPPARRFAEQLAFRALAAGGPSAAEVLARLLAAGMPANVVDAQREPLLAAAARLQRWDEVRLLLRWRADPLRCRLPRESALALAARHGRADVVRLLLERGAAADPDQALWALGFAASAEVVRAFVEVVPHLVRGPAGVNGLVVAAHNGKLETVKALLDAGVDIDAIGIHDRTALQGAAIFGHIAVLNELLRRGANVNERSNYDDTALHLAAHRDQEECVRALLEAGANPTLRNNLGMLPSDYAHNDTVHQMLQGTGAPNVQGDE